MAAGKNHRQQQQGAVASAAATEPSVARRLWRVVRAVLYMLRRGLPSGRKLAMDLSLLLHRGKIAAGKALGDRFLHHGRHAGANAAFSYAARTGAAGGGGAFSCAALDPGLAVHEPSRRRREVEFSCSNTPSSTSRGGGGALGLLGAAARRRRRHRNSSRQQQQQQQRLHRDDEAAEASNGYLMQCYYGGYDAAEVARVFEMLSDDDADYDDDDDRRLFSADDDAAPTPGAASSSVTTPSPAQAHLLRLPAAAGKKHQAPRLADGSTPSPAADGGAAGQVDRRADEFIRRFYEQLRAQRSAASTPDYYGYASTGASPSPYAAARTPRARAVITAGTA